MNRTHISTLAAAVAALWLAAPTTANGKSLSNKTTPPRKRLVRKPTSVQTALKLEE